MTAPATINSVTFDPVAFGLRAVAVAMKAKCGRASWQEADALLVSCAANVPGDRDAHVAVSAFYAALSVDQAKAGADLHDFLTVWRAGEMAVTADRTEAVLRDQVPALFDWQERKDCGHD